MNNHPFSKSPFCRLYKFIIPGFISLLARKMMQGEGPKPGEFRCFPERREYVRAI